MAGKGIRRNDTQCNPVRSHFNPASHPSFLPRDYCIRPTSLTHSLVSCPVSTQQHTAPHHTLPWLALPCHAMPCTPNTHDTTQRRQTPPLGEGCPVCASPDTTWRLDASVAGGMGVLTPLIAMAVVAVAGGGGGCFIAVVAVAFANEAAVLFVVVVAVRPPARPPASRRVARYTSLLHHLLLSLSLSLSLTLSVPDPPHPPIPMRTPAISSRTAFRLTSCTSSPTSTSIAFRGRFLFSPSSSTHALQMAWLER
jgi:hypothetical protein